MIDWLATIVRWIAGAMMAAFFGVFLFSMWVTLTNRYRPGGTPPNENRGEKPSEKPETKR